MSYVPWDGPLDTIEALECAAAGADRIAYQYSQLFHAPHIRLKYGYPPSERDVETALRQVEFLRRYLRNLAAVASRHDPLGYYVAFQTPYPLDAERKEEEGYAVPRFGDFRGLKFSIIRGVLWLQSHGMAELGTGIEAQTAAFVSGMSATLDHMELHRKESGGFDSPPPNDAVLSFDAHIDVFGQYLRLTEECLIDLFGDEDEDDAGSDPALHPDCRFEQRAQSIAEVEERLLHLAKSVNGFRTRTVDGGEFSVRRWAELAGTSEATVRKTAAYQIARDAAGLARRPRPRKVGGSEFVESIQADDEQLAELIRDQERNAEASPLDATGDNPRVRPRV